MFDRIDQEKGVLYHGRSEFSDEFLIRSRKYKYLRTLN
jgi:hypothetical protein